MGIVLDEIQVKKEAAVYELSSRGALVGYLRRRFHNLTISEFYDDVRPGDFKKGVQCQDVQHLTYPDQTFDLVTCTEVFEHVPDDIRGFREIFRVLKDGGHFIFTASLGDQQATVERSAVQDNTVVHLLPPRYHHDRLRGKNAVLVFRNYGYDISARLGTCGFDARVRDITSERHAVAGAKVVVCRKKASLQDEQ